MMMIEDEALIRILLMMMAVMMRALGKMTVMTAMVTMPPVCGR